MTWSEIFKESITKIRFAVETAMTWIWDYTLRVHEQIDEEMGEPYIE